MAEVADYTRGEPPPTASGGPSMHDMVTMDMFSLEPVQYPINLDVRRGAGLIVELMHDRKEFGIRKYGMPLRAHNGRNPLNDLIDELGDALVYAKQQVEEANLPARTFLSFYYKDLLVVTMKYMLLKEKIDYIVTKNGGANDGNTDSA